MAATREVTLKLNVDADASKADAAMDAFGKRVDSLDDKLKLDWSVGKTPALPDIGAPSVGTPTIPTPTAPPLPTLTLPSIPAPNIGTPTIPTPAAPSMPTLNTGVPTTLFTPPPNASPLPPPSAEWEAYRKAMGKLSEAMRPDVVEQRVKAELRLGDARKKLSDVMDAEREKQRPTAIPVHQGIDLEKEARTRAQKSLTGQEDQLQDLKVGMDPAILRERADLTNKIEEAQQQLNKALEAEKNVLEPERQRKKLLEEINAGLDAQAKATLKLRESAAPANVARQVAQNKEESKARRDLASAEQKERTRQWKPETFFGKVAKSFGGQAPAEAAPKGQGGMMQSAMEGVGVGGEEGAGALVGELGSLGEVLGPVGIAAGVATAALGALGQAAVSLGGLASPVKLKFFNRAMDDMQATIGQRLIPVLDLMTKGVRLLGDVLMTVLPSTSEMTDALDPLSEALDEMRDAAQDLAPILKEALTVGLHIAAGELKQFVWVLEHLTPLGLIAGLGKGEKPLDSSFGAAPKKAEFMDIESYEKSFQAAGMGGGPAEKTAKSTEETAKNTNIIAGILATILSAGLIPFNPAGPFGAH